ncbi:helix-turn-helix domain-containing protein [Viridibacillus sp. NPDC096237]|uniref:helix-turn-helix domain-containing protein n=1 Tax=Viridibacillus sp. NPDC096237 TaxID=3390721 RepID=UPI003CFF44A7
MKSFGWIFRDLRLERGYNLKEVADGIVTISFLSKFERGDSDISLSNFYALLEKLNITLSEFTLITNDYTSTYFENLIEQIKVAYENNNTSYLQNIADIEQANWKNRNLKIHRCNEIMTKALLYNLDKQKSLSDEEIQFLCEYLLTIENWSIYELALFGNSLSSLKVETVVTLSKELINRGQLFIKLKKNKIELIRILLNTVVICLENHNISSALYFLTVLDSLLNNTDFYFEKTKFLFLKGLYKIKIGELDKGTVLANKALFLMEELDSAIFVNTHKNYLDNFLKNQNN